MSTHARRRSSWLTWYAGFIAASAWFGVAGLATGYLFMQPEVVGRLPLDSPVIGALGLALLVAGPATTLTVMARHHDFQAAHAAVVVGCMLIGWIILEAILIHDFSFLQPFYGLAGAVLAVVGHRLGKHQRPSNASIETNR